jgi:hypothetical protein
MTTRREAQAAIYTAHLKDHPTKWWWQRRSLERKTDRALLGWHTGNVLADMLNRKLAVCPECGARELFDDGQCSNCLGIPCGDVVSETDQ